MGRDDGGEAKVAAAIAMTAALFSPRVRGLLRRGAVRGLAGVLTAGDAVAAFARGVSRGIQESTGAARPAEPPPTAADAPSGGAPVAAPSAPAESATAAGARSRPARRPRTKPPTKGRAAAPRHPAPSPAAPAAGTRGEASDE